MEDEFRVSDKLASGIFINLWPVKEKNPTQNLYHSRAANKLIQLVDLTQRDKHIRLMYIIISYG